MRKLTTRYYTVAFACDDELPQQAAKDIAAFIAERITGRPAVVVSELDVMAVAPNPPASPVSLRAE